MPDRDKTETDQGVCARSVQGDGGSFWGENGAEASGSSRDHAHTSGSSRGGEGSGHTPGPWRVSERVAVIGRDRFLVVLSDERWVAHVLEGAPASEEDAALIAATPGTLDMLTAWDAIMLQAHDALEAARDKMRGCVEPDDSAVFEQISSALYAVRARPAADPSSAKPADRERSRDEQVPISKSEGHQ